MTPSPDTASDIVNDLAGIQDGSPLALLRAQRKDIATYAQGSYGTLLEPEDEAGVSRYEREMIALRVGILNSNAALQNHHRDRLRHLGASDEQIAAVESFPQGTGLSDRDRLILAHVDRLTIEPRAASQADTIALQAGGLSPRDIVTIAQLIAFLSFQVRLLAGLKALGEQ